MKRGMTPKELCDVYYPVQKETFEKLGISFDIFSRTSKPIRYQVVREFYQRLWEKGYIYPKTIRQWWCPRCEIFLPGRLVIGTYPGAARWASTVMSARSADHGMSYSRSWIPSARCASRGPR